MCRGSRVRVSQSKASRVADFQMPSGLDLGNEQSRFLYAWPAAKDLTCTCLSMASEFAHTTSKVWVRVYVLFGYLKRAPLCCAQL